MSTRAHREKMLVEFKEYFFVYFDLVPGVNATGRFRWINKRDNDRWLQLLQAMKFYSNTQIAQKAWNQYHLSLDCFVNGDYTKYED